MEQTFAQQCREDSRLSMKLIFIAKNFAILTGQQHRNEDIAEIDGLQTSEIHAPTVQDLPTCQACGDRFKPANKGSWQKYCSTHCKDQAHRTRNRIEHTCSFCNKLFWACKYDIAHARHPDRICCSRECANKARPDNDMKVNVECAWCDKMLKRRKSRIKSHLSFCSASCSAKKYNTDRALARKAAKECDADHDKVVS